jgi:hypothetical protein
MRILGLGLLTILLIALLRFTLITPDVASFVGLASGDTRRSYDLTSPSIEDGCLAPGSGTSHVIPVRERDTWTALTGSPGFASVSFDLPRRAAIVSGALILDIASELQDEAVARLRVNVNGERRGEIILAAGSNESEIRIDILPRDLVQSRLDVTLAAVGTFPQQMCHREWTGGLVARIEPTSRIELETTGPMTDINDRLLATGSPQRLVWPTNAGSDGEIDRLMTYAIGQRLEGVRSEFVTESAPGCSNAVTFQPAELTALSRTAPLVDAGVAANTWPQSISLEGPNADVRFFEYESTWRHTYDLRDTPQAEYPTALDLRMRVVGLQDDARWLLSVTLNNTLVHSERLSGDTLDIVREVALAPELHAFANALEVRIISDERQDLAICEGGAVSTAQLLPATKLLGGVAPEDSSISDFISALSGPLQLRVSDTVTALEASSAIEFLADTFGEKAAWQPVDDVDPTRPYVHVTNRDDLPARHEAMIEQFADHDFWLTWPQRPERGQLPYRQVKLTGDTMAAFASDEAPRIGAIVAVPRAAPSVSVETPAPSDP